MKNLAHFTIDNLNDLISERQNFFRIDDFVDVNFQISLSRHRQTFDIVSTQIMMRISNKFPHNITITSTADVFFFSPILTDELGLCFTFNSRISPYLSPK